MPRPKGSKNKPRARVTESRHEPEESTLQVTKTCHTAEVVAETPQKGLGTMGDAGLIGAEKPNFKPKRHPLGESRDPVEYLDKDPNYEYRIFNDGPGWEGRIERAKLAGWEPVTGTGMIGQATVDNTRLPGATIGRPVGGGVNGYLMRIPKEWYEEDVTKREEKRCLEIEAQLGRTNEVTNQYGMELKTTTALGFTEGKEGG